MGFRAGDWDRSLSLMARQTRERKARDVRDQRDRAEFYARIRLEALNNIQEILNRPESVGDFVQDMEDIQHEVTRARQARW